MPWLAPLLPLPVPVPSVVSDEPLVVRHALVSGEPLESPSAEDGVAVGKFLRALHDSSVAEAVRQGLPPTAETESSWVAEISRFKAQVVPLIPVSQQDSALTILEALREFPADTVVHGDLGPEHVLVDGGRVSGVIDFGDAHVGDAAIDLAWALHGAPKAFAHAVAAAYGVTGELRRRALVWHQLGPWHEVTYGADIGDIAVQQSGLAGVLERLKGSGEIPLR